MQIKPAQELIDEDTRHRLAQTITAKAWPSFLHENAQVALQALEILGIAYRLEDLDDLTLIGRFYPYKEHVRLDVGHNPLAARRIVSLLPENTVLIYNTLADKDYEAVLRILKPKIKRVEIIPIEGQRAVDEERLYAVLRRLEIPAKPFTMPLDTQTFYLVFGSFYTVEAFLKRAEG